VGIDSNFIYLHGELSHEHNLPGGAQVFARIHGQLADQHLLNTEEVAGGGLDTVRGYLEAEALADSGAFGTFELRTPSLFDWWRGAKATTDDDEKKNEFRLYAFVDAGYLKVISALPETPGHFTLASVGLGSRLNLFDHVHGTLDCGLPLIGQSQSPTQSGDWRFTFRVWADF
jgi:hemolysin activation/secretion protein